MAPVPAAAVAPTGAAEPVFGSEEYAAAGDVYEGPAAEELYAGPTAAEAIDGAPVPSPAVGTGSATAAAASGNEAAGPLGRGVLFGLGAGVVAALVWYGVAAITDWKLGPIAAVMGAFVGYATAAGCGRTGFDVGLLGCGLAVCSMVAGEYLLWDHFYKEMASEEAAYERLLTDIGRDGRVTREEISRYYAWGEEGEAIDLGQFSLEEVNEIRRFLMGEYQAYVAEGGSGSGQNGLPLGEFFALFFHDIWNLVFFGIGAVAAFKIGDGREE